MALTHLDKAIELRPNMITAWYYKGRFNEFLGNRKVARQAYIRALEINPKYTMAYKQLVGLLRKLEEPEEAARYLEMGLRVAEEPSELASLKNPPPAKQ